MTYPNALGRGLWCFSWVVAVALLAAVASAESVSADERASTQGPVSKRESVSGELQVGSRAPDFVLSGSDGKQYALSQFVGERGVVLAWFPKAFTPG